MIFFIYVVIVTTYSGFIRVPSEGDSLNYHIPLARAYLTGTIFDPSQILNADRFLKYSPGASQGILAMFYFLNIPPGLFNVVGIVFLFLSLLFLGKNVGFARHYNIIFATSIATLNGIVRWHDTQIIDIYLASFFALSLGLLQNPKKSFYYFLKLGITLGMLAGSKYSGLFFAATLLVVYSRKILDVVSVRLFFTISFPFLILGASWYIRNLLLTGNPLYPQGFLVFKDYNFGILNAQVWKVFSAFPFGFFGTINAFISEYMVWTVSVPVVLGAFIYKLYKKIVIENPLILLFLVGLINYTIYLFLPSDYYEHIMVSVVRYSYPAFVPFALLLYKLCEKKYSEKIGFVAISNMFFLSFPITYNPKLVFVLVLVVLLLFGSTTNAEGKDQKVKKK